jgi:tetratricopeptide (TPR) repeat protein
MGGIVGRHRELAAVLDRVKAARARHESTIFLRGEAGIGKSRLVAEVLDQARLLGYTVLAGRAEELERSVPYAALREALEPALRAERSVALLDAVDAVRSSLALTPTPRVDRQTGRTSLQVLYAEGERLLRAWSDRQPLVLAIDDLHAADRDTLTVVSLLSRHLSESRVVLLGALRLHAPDRSLELDALVDRLSASGRATVVDLGALDRDDVKAMIGTALGAPAADDLVAHVWALSRGNPFFAEESLDALRTAGAIELRNGTWTLAAQAPLVAASRRSTVLHRVFRLGRPVRAVARAASALQYVRLDRVDLLADLTALSSSEVTAALDTLGDANILRLGASEQMEFVHPIVRSTLYDDLGPAERRRIHARTAAYLRDARTSGRPIGVAEIAIHLTESAEPGDLEAAELLIQAADSSAHTAPLSAAGLYQHALRLLPEGNPAAGEVLGKAARASFLAGRFDDAATAGRAALAILPTGRLSARTAALTVNALTSSHRFDDALELADRILAASHEPMARLRTERATLLLYLDRFDDARAEGERALHSAGSDQVALAGALGQLAALAFAEGRMVDSREFLDRQRSASDAVGPVALLSTLTQRSIYLALFGAVREAREVLDDATKLSVELGEAPFRSTLQVARTITDWLTGEWDRAIEGWEAVKGSESESQIGAMARCAVVSILSERGQLSEARAEASGFEESTFAASFTLWAKAVLAVASGDDEGALELLRTAVTKDLASGRRSALHLLLSLQAEIEHRTGDEDAASETTALLVSVARASGFPSARTAALRTVGAIEQNAGAACEALEIAEANGLSVDAARARWVLAHAGAEAAANLRAAHDAFAAFGAERSRRATSSELRRLGAPVPRSRPGADGTSSTDWHLARLVHEGLTNRQIASTLHLSPKTVEVYLTRLYAKTGVANRLELALAFADGRVLTPE